VSGEQWAESRKQKAEGSERVYLPLPLGEGWGEGLVVRRLRPFPSSPSQREGDEKNYLPRSPSPGEGRIGSAKRGVQSHRDGETGRCWDSR
jgi:hypothetical protein